MTTKKPVVLVTAVGAPPGLNALRALVESERYELVACDADKRSPGLYQFGIAHEVVPSAVAQPDEYMEALDDIVTRHHVEFVLPCIEGEVQLLAARQNELKALGAKLLLPETSVVEKAVDKFSATNLAAACGLGCPGTILIRASGETGQRVRILKDFMGRCEAPWIIKPVHGHGMKDVETVTSPQQAVAYIERVRHDVLVQEKIPGAVGSMHLVGLIYNEQSRVIRRFCSRSIRTLYPDGGPATAGISLRNEALIQDTERLVDALGGWRGPANVEWMLDPRSGKFKFIEINPRLWGYGFLAVGSGANFPVMTVETGLGNDVGPDPGYRAGVTMLRTTVDLIFDECPFEVGS